MSVLIDTSVWVEHFRAYNSTLVSLMELDLALTHPMVLGELACGTPPAPRIQTLKEMGLLQQAKQASLSEVMTFIEQNKLYGLGCGLVDIIILASTLITPNAKLWTLDKKLESLSERFDVLYRPRLH